MICAAPIRMTTANDNPFLSAYHVVLSSMSRHQVELSSRGQKRKKKRKKKKQTNLRSSWRLEDRKAAMSVCLLSKSGGSEVQFPPLRPHTLGVVFQSACTKQFRAKEPRGASWYSCDRPVHAGLREDRS